MISIQLIAQLMFFVQVLHSLEELLNNFQKRWFLKKLSFNSFLSFEIVHNIFWGLVIFIPTFPFKLQLLGIFLILMFTNGIEHVVWYMWEKKYVPGLFTAFIHIIIFTIFFFSNITNFI
jgi:hypothetical protein